jgi:hypothetical protein
VRKTERTVLQVLVDLASLTMPKGPTETIAAELTVPEQVLLFCLAWRAVRKSARFRGLIAIAPPSASRAAAVPASSVARGHR